MHTLIIDSSKEVTSDKELFLLIAKGEKNAFIQIYTKYLPQVVPVVTELFTDDQVVNEIIQESFLRLWISREKLINVDEPKRWIFRIASNVCYSFLKETLATNKMMNTVHYETYHQDGEITDKVAVYTLAIDFHEAIRSLTPEQKKVYQLSRDRGLTVSDIAGELNLSPNHVRVLLNSSLEFVDEYLQEKGHIFL